MKSYRILHPSLLEDKKTIYYRTKNPVFVLTSLFDPRRSALAEEKSRNTTTLQAQSPRVFPCGLAPSKEKEVQG